MLLGITEIALPTIATLAFEIFFGWLLLLTGIIGRGDNAIESPFRRLRLVISLCNRGNHCRSRATAVAA